MNVRGGGFRLFTLFGTPVYVQGSYLILLLLFGIMPAAEGSGLASMFVVAVVVTVSLLVHEFGHVLAARRSGHRCEVYLWGFGGFTVPDGRSRGWPAVALSFAGPFAGLVLWAIAWFAFMPPGGVEAGWRLSLAAMFSPYTVAASWGGFGNQLLNLLWAELCWINLVWSIFNLLPIHPLDGGHITEELLRMRLRAFEAQRIGARIAIGTCVIVALGLFSIGLTIGAIMLLYLAYMNYERLRSLA